MEQWNVNLTCEVIGEASTTDVLEPSIDVMEGRKPDRVVPEFDAQNKFSLLDGDFMSSERNMSPSYSSGSLDQLLDNELTIVVSQMKNEIKTAFLPVDNTDNEQLLGSVPTLNHINDSSHTELIDTQCSTLDDKSNKMIKPKKKLNVGVVRMRNERGRQRAVCSQCSKVFADKWHLNRHEILHSKEKPFTCPACYRTFTRKDKMDSHKCHAPSRSNRPKKFLPFKCPDDKLLPIEELLLLGFVPKLNHSNDSNHTEYVDTQCSDTGPADLQSFPDTSDISDVNFTEINTMKTEVLDQNTVRTNKSNNIAGARKKTIKSKAKQRHDNLGLSTINSTAKIPQPLPILFADSVNPLNAIHKKVALIDAQLDTLGDKSDKMIKLNENLNVGVIRMRKKGVRQPAACSHCSRVFVDMWHMKRHEILHSQERPFTCPACYRTFSRKDKMNSHKCHAPSNSRRPKKILPLESPDDDTLSVEPSDEAKRLEPLVIKKLKVQPQSAPCPKSFNNKNISKNGKPVGTLKLITSEGTSKLKTLIGTVKPITLISKKLKEEVINLDSSEDESGANVADLCVGKHVDDDSSGTECMSELSCRDTYDRTVREVYSDADVAPFVMDCENISDDSQCTDTCPAEWQSFPRTSIVSDVGLREMSMTKTVEVPDQNTVQTNKSNNIAGRRKKTITSKPKQKRDNFSFSALDSTAKHPRPLPVLFTDSVNPLNAIQKKFGLIDARMDTLDDQSNKVKKLKKNLNIGEIRMRKKGVRQPAACSHCSRVFVDMWHMKRHEILHSQERPFTCPACYRTFTRKDKMNSHKCHAPSRRGRPKKLRTCEDA